DLAVAEVVRRRRQVDAELLGRCGRFHGLRRHVLQATVRYPRHVSSRFAIAFPLGVTPGKWTRAFEQRFPRVELVVRPSEAPLAVLAAGEADMVFVRDAHADDVCFNDPVSTE